MFSLRKLCMFYIIGSLFDAPGKRNVYHKPKLRFEERPYGLDTPIADMDAHRLRTTRRLEPHDEPQASETAITGPSRHAVPASLQIVALSFSKLQRAAMSVFFSACPSSPPSCLLRPRGWDISNHSFAQHSSDGRGLQHPPDVTVHSDIRWLAPSCFCQGQAKHMHLVVLANTVGAAHVVKAFLA